MNYKAYYEKLIEESHGIKEKYSLNEFYQTRDTDYYLVIRNNNGFKYSCTIASDRSQTFGKDFKGLVVEIYSNCNENSNFFEQLKESKELKESLEQLNLEIRWQQEGESAKGTACRIYASLEADIEDETQWEKYIEWQLDTMDKFLEVFPKYTDKKQTNINENEFYNWINRRVQHATTVQGYRRSLKEDIPHKLKIPSVFDITNIQELQDIYSRFGINGDLYDWNMSIGNGRPKASLGNYIKFLQYKSVKNAMNSYKNNPENFSLHGATNFFKITEDTEKYPIKAICRIVSRDLGLQENFTTNDAKNKLEKLFTNIQFIDKTVINVITNIKNIILYGVPGVGKTYSHKMLIDLIESKACSNNQIFNQLQIHQGTSNFEKASNENRVKFLTFHQSFGYEDFIEGFRPNENGEIKLQNGVFKDFCNKAEKNKEKNFYFVIDEINRGNISKIFGELITLIEENKRETLHVTLPYSKKTFSIPSNLYIIGTMNSTDKSIALIDIALRRRFTFLKIKPNHELITDKNAQELMQELNEKIKETLGEEHLIGHSYFMNIPNKEELQFVVNYKIKPLMEEYFYGDDAMLNSVVNILDRYIEKI